MIVHAMQGDRAQALHSGEASAAVPRRRLGPFVWPLAIFAVIGVFLGIGLTLNPREIPSPLIDKPVPRFELAAVKGRTLGLSTGDLRGEVSIVNVFASWCAACRDEHPLWMDLARRRLVPLHGLNYKDQVVADAAPHRRELGVPEALASCHTATLGDYALEGHVPASDVKRMWFERTKAKGLAVAGMTPGSPGMPGQPQPYATFAFDERGSKIFARH